MLHAKEAVFRFSVQSTPETFDLAKAPNTLSSYVLNALSAGLYRYQQEKLQSYGFSQCVQITPLRVKCQIRADWRWSDGRSVTAEQIVQGWQILRDLPSPRMDNFNSIKSVERADQGQVLFSLKYPDSDFYYRLLDPALGPRHPQAPADGRVTAGPYFLSEQKVDRLVLKSNPHFFMKSPRPTIEVLFVDSDTTALRLFQKGQMNWLRRLTTEHLLEYAQHPGLRVLPLARFDYIGFSAKLDKQNDLRQALVHSLHTAFLDFQKLFNALGPPGCFGLPERLTQGPVCYSRAPARVFENQTQKNPLKLYYASQGGDDIERGMTLFQMSWKKSGLHVQLSSQEMNVLSALLKKANTQPDLFRRGVSLDRPTCLAAAEIFTTGHPDNLIGLNDKRYDALVAELRKSVSVTQCRKVMQYLLMTYRIIPMGQIHFRQLSDQKFNNIFINELNQVDLSQLQAAQ